MDMMKTIIEGVTNGENCLIESPTGTGKTAALLCSLLAWQKDCYDRNDNCHEIMDRKGACNCGQGPPPSSHFNSSSPTPSTSRTPPSSLQNTPTKRTPTKSPTITPSKLITSPLKKMKFEEEEGSQQPDKDGDLSEAIIAQEKCAFCIKQSKRNLERPPKIYYLTRTHSQIAQVVKQLKNSAYKNVKMTILSSREPTCITNLSRTEENQTVNSICREAKNKYWKAKNLERKEEFEGLSDLEAKQLTELKKGICDYYFYYKNSPDFTAPQEFSRFQADGAFDLEDVKEYGKVCEKCPYYGCYSMHNDADIVFCAYNYLVDPGLREYTKIQFENSVLVFDEAHNIEDMCRNAFTLTFDLQQFEKDVRLRVDNMLKKSNDSDNSSPVIVSILHKASAIFKHWSEFIRKKGSEIVKNDQLSFKDKELQSFLEEMNLTADSLKRVIVDAELDLDEKYKNDMGEERPFKIPWAVANYLRKLLLPLEYLFKEETDGVGGAKDFTGYLFRKKKGSEFLYKFEIYCLNPAVGFKALKDNAYSIIVASGTLTPMESLEVELATDFKWKLQTNHVIPKENVFAEILGVGPKKVELTFNFADQNKEVIQDELGETLCKICEIVPNGVLVFLPSYLLMNKLEEKWRWSGLIQRIERTKKIFWEPRDKRRFLADMEEYKLCAKGGDGWDGCVMFAVFRGKISEGIDFADEQARAVVTVGIPYAYMKAPNVESKKEYNQMRLERGDTGFMPAFEWYHVQALRAMNQGIGRCVRHKDDWGAIILIDCRMRRNVKYISKWAADSLNRQPHIPDGFKDFMERLEGFFERMKGSESENGSGSRRRNITIEYDNSNDTQD